MGRQEKPGVATLFCAKPERVKMHVAIFIIVLLVLSVELEKASMVELLAPICLNFDFSGKSYVRWQ